MGNERIRESNKKALTFHLFLDRLGWVQPMLDVIGVGELQTKVVLLDQVQRVEHLLVQIAAHRLFL